MDDTHEYRYVDFFLTDSIRFGIIVTFQSSSHKLEHMIYMRVWKYVSI